MKRLIQNINSRYIAAANHLRPKGSRQRIVAYVESYDDISFWRTLFDEYEGSLYHFQVMLPSRSTLSKGKKAAMMNLLGSKLGENMIACVDSDYDYLLQGESECSRELIESPYVLHTYSYAIENLKCYAGSLHQICVQSTLNDRNLIDLEAFMQLYSQISYPLFIWEILFYRSNRLSLLPMMDFCHIVRLDTVDLNRPARALELLQLRVNKKLRFFEQHFADLKRETEALKKELAGLGVLPQETYMYIQGHHIMENVVLRLLTPVCNRLRREREKEITTLALHNKQYRNELASYRHSLCPVDVILKKNTLYQAALPYRKLKKDVEKFLNSL